MNIPVSENAALRFFREYVEPALKEWRADPISERRARILANELNSLIDYYWHSFGGTNSESAFRANNVRIFRKQVMQRNSCLALIRDVADAHKHAFLSRQDASITSVDQVGAQSVSYGQAYGMCYGGGERLVITDDDGVEHPFSVIAECAYDYWRSMLG